MFDDFFLCEDMFRHPVRKHFTHKPVIFSEMGQENLLKDDQVKKRHQQDYYDRVENRSLLQLNQHS